MNRSKERHRKSMASNAHNLMVNSRNQVNIENLWKRHWKETQSISRGNINARVFYIAKDMNKDVDFTVILLYS